MKKLRILGLISCLILLFSCVFVLSACDDVEKVTFKESDFYGVWVYVWSTQKPNESTDDPFSLPRQDSVEFLNVDGQLTVKYGDDDKLWTADAELKGNSVIAKIYNYIGDEEFTYFIFTMDNSKSFITAHRKMSTNGKIWSTWKYCSDYSYANRD